VTTIDERGQGVDLEVPHGTVAGHGVQHHEEQNRQRQPGRGSRSALFPDP